MTIVSLQQLTADMRSRARDLEGRAGLVPQATDRPLEADDLLFYICHAATPMAQFLREHGLFVDEAGLPFDVRQFETIRKVAQQVVTERREGNLDGVWRRFDLDGDEAVAGNGTAILTAIAALDTLYGPRLRVRAPRPPIRSRSARYTTAASTVPASAMVPEGRGPRAAELAASRTHWTPEHSREATDGRVRLLHQREEA